MEYELKLVAKVERLENGEYEKAWEEIVPAIQELYSVEGNNVVDDKEAEKTEAPAEFIELIEAQEPQKTKADFDEGSMVYMYDTDGTLLFENSSMFTAGD